MTGDGGDAVLRPGERLGYLGLGSNLGDRRAQLQGAVDGLARHGVRVLASSALFDTDPVDVDLLLLGDEPYRSERLTLPHREVTSRRFVLIPLLDLDIDLTLPDGTRLADSLAALPLDEGVRRVDDPLDVPA